MTDDQKAWLVGVFLVLLMFVAGFAVARKLPAEPDADLLKDAVRYAKYERSKNAADRASIKAHEIP